MSIDTPVFPRLDELENAAMRREPLKVAVAYPCSPDSLAAVCDASSQGMIEPILVGPRSRIETCAASIAVELSNVMLVDAPDDATSSSQAAVTLVSRGEADALMKGSQHTDELLSAVISHEVDLRTSRRMSHCFWFDLPAYHKPLMVTDAVVPPASKRRSTSWPTLSILRDASASNVLKLRYCRRRKPST